MGNDEPDVISVVPLAEADEHPRTSRPWLRNTAFAATALVGVVTLSFGVAAMTAQTPRDDTSSSTTTEDRLATPAARAVYAALDASTSTGGYEVSYEFVIDPPGTDPEECGAQAPFTDSDGSESPRGIVAAETCASYGSTITVTGHGVVHLNPYFLDATSNLSNLGDITVRTDGNQIVEEGGANYGGTLEGGQSLSGFASLVESTFGDGPGALTMLALASPTGYLSLSAETVTDVAPAGTGEVGGVPVTFYDVTSDTTAMRDLPQLTSEQRRTIDDALAVLRETGFTEASTRIAVDADGYVRESTSIATFADGTTMSRHMTLSRFGCAGTGPTPANPNGTHYDLPPECADPSTATSSTAPLPSTTAEVTTSTPAAPTTATAAPTTSATTTAPSTSAATTTTTTLETTTTVAASTSAPETTTTTAP